MGGIGSGNYLRGQSRSTVDDMKSLRIGTLAQNGWLNSGRTCSYSWTIGGRPYGDIRVTAAAGHVFLNYRHRDHGGEWTPESYPVQIDTTACHFGGSRSWFLCPARGCGRRVAVLYGGTIFACRNCHRLAYPSESENARDRTARKADKLRDRLKWPAGIFEGSGWGRPRHMHDPTYKRLMREYDHLEAGALGEIMAWLNRFSDRPESHSHHRREGGL